MTTAPFPRSRLTRCMLLIFALGFTLALLHANAGCSSGAVCYRKTDCAVGTDCVRGQCVRQLPRSDAGAADSSSVALDADTADLSQTPDAN